MALLTWLSDHALILLLGCGTLFNVYWLHRCRERLHLRCSFPCCTRFSAFSA